MHLTPPSPAAASTVAARRIRLGAAATAVLLCVTACAGQAAPQPGASAAVSPQTAPLQFDETAAVDLPDFATSDNTVLYEKTAYINTPDGVTVFDTLTGKTLGKVTVPHPAQPADPPRSDRVTVGNVGGTDVIAVAVPLAQPDRASSPDTQTVDIVLIDATTGTLIRTVSTQVPRPPANRLPPRAMAIVDNDLIMNNRGTTLRISLSDGSVRWTATDVEIKIASGDGSRLIGATAINQQAHLRGIDAATGQTIWTDPAGAGLSIGIITAGPNLVLTTSENFNKIVNADTGEIVSTGPAVSTKDLTCVYDEQQTTICSAPGVWSAAIDASTGQWIWQHTDAPVTLTAAWRGLAYGTINNGPVVVDTHTAAVLTPAASIAPLMVNSHVGLAKSGTRLRAYAALTK